MFFRKKKKWMAGSVFLIPLLNGKFSVGQVLSAEERALGSIVCALTSNLADSKCAKNVSINKDSVISVLFTTPDFLNSDDWPIVDQREPLVSSDFIDVSKMIHDDFIDVDIIAAINIVALMNAYFSLTPWNNFYNEDYLDKLLISPDKKPATVLYIEKE